MQLHLSSSSSSYSFDRRRETILLLLALIVILLDCCQCARKTRANLNPKTRITQRGSRPLIGILTEPTYPEHSRFGKAYIPLDYVQWIESAGGRVVPVPFDSSPEELQHYFDGVSGWLFIGGDAAIDTSTQYEQAAAFIVKHAVKSYSAGDYVPIWGTCLGLELLLIVTTGDSNILEQFNAENISLPLNFSQEAQSSRLLSKAPANVLSALSNRNMTINWHSFGISPQKFSSVASLSTFYRILSTNLDKDGKQFVSLMEGQQVPIYASQWHPERVQFDFSQAGEPLDHSQEAITAIQYLADFFVEEARQNDHHFNPEEEEKLLIYNYTPLRSPSTVDNFYEKVFFFD